MALLGRLYALGTSRGPYDAIAGPGARYLHEFDRETLAVLGSVALARAVPLPLGSGLFSGYGRLAVHDCDNLHVIDPVTGTVDTIALGLPRSP